MNYAHTILSISNWEALRIIYAFTQNWRNGNNWIVPPIDFVARSTSHLILCKAEGTLIVPKWPSSYFWTFIFKRNFELAF
jgi:hypothetical protein